MTTFTFFGGLFNGNSTTVNFEGVGDVSNLEPDSTTLEFPTGMTFQDALDLKQVRIVRETPSLASRAHQVVRYRNGDSPGVWLHVGMDGLVYKTKGKP